MSVPRQRRRRRRKVEIEAERAAKRRNLMEMVAKLRESHVAETQNHQNHAMDLTKVLGGGGEEGGGVCVCVWGRGGELQT